MSPQTIRRYEAIEIEPLPPQPPLLAALGQARVKILDSDDVAAYQAEKLNRERAKNRWPLRMMGALAVLIAAAATGLEVAFLSRVQVHNWWQVPVLFALSFIPFCIACASGRLVYLCVKPGINLLQWRSYGIGHCWRRFCLVRRYVQIPGVGEVQLPAQAMAIAEAIAATGVESEFRLHQLDTDPFLEVVNGFERYFVAVWDETGFYA